jgi:peptidylprolyl isomerase
MKRIIITIFCLSSAFAEEPVAPAIPVVAAVEEPAVKDAVAQQVLDASEAFGKLTAIQLKSMESVGIKFNADVAIQAFKDAMQGSSELKPQIEYIEVLANVSKTALEETSAENLKQAEEFLAQNKNQPGVKELEANRLQYKIEKEGTGPAVEETSTPLVRYTGSLMGDSETSVEENRIDMTEDEAMLIPGFKKALIGMKEGEKRIAYIHPGLGFHNRKLDPKANKLITYEIEVLKANMPAEQPLDSLSPSHVKGNPEIALPFEETKAVR